MSRSNAKKWPKWWPLVGVLGIAVYTLFDIGQEIKEAKEAERQREKERKEILAKYEEEEIDVPEYIYIDQHGVCHKSLDCFYLNPVKSEYWYRMEGLSMEGQIPYGVQRLALSDLTLTKLEWTCSCCISDQDYKKYKEIAEENYNNMSEIKKLYIKLIDNGFSPKDIGDEDTFAAKVGDAKNRKELYDWVKSEGYDLGDYNEYEKRLTSSIVKPDLSKVPPSRLDKYRVNTASEQDSIKVKPKEYYNKYEIK